MTCPASLPGMSVFAVLIDVVRGSKIFTDDALEEATPDLAW
jgi:hypothetical protein